MALVQGYPGSQTARKHANYPFLSGSETCLGNNPLWRTDIQLTIKVSFCGCRLRSFNHVLLFVTLWSIVCQALLSVDSPGKNTGVDCHAFLQGIFPYSGTEPTPLALSPALQEDSLPLNHQGTPKFKLLIKENLRLPWKEKGDTYQSPESAPVPPQLLKAQRFPIFISELALNLILTLDVSLYTLLNVVAQTVKNLPARLGFEG